MATEAETTKAILQSICQHIASNYKEIVGIEIEQIEFQQNMDSDFYEESIKDIVAWVAKKYPGYDVSSKKIHEQFLTILDQELLKRMYKGWAYIN